MKAIAALGYGPLENLREIDAALPDPGRREVRVRVAASALNPADYKVVLGQLKFLHGRTRPLIVGYDFSGTVDAVGPDVTEVKVGDDVFGFLPYGPGNKRGAFAEALIARVDEIALKPKTVSHDIAAAAATTGLTAIQALRNLGRLASGGRVLITGVSGGVGSIGVGIARRMGASVVAAVGSGIGLEVAQRIGATSGYDRTARRLPDDIQERFDIVFDAAAHYRWGNWKRVLAPGGAFVTTLPSLAFLQDKVMSMFSGTRVHFVNVKSRAEDLRLLAGWLETGLQVPLTDTIPVRDIGKGLARLQAHGGRFAVKVTGGF